MTPGGDCRPAPLAGIDPLLPPTTNRDPGLRILVDFSDQHMLGSLSNKCAPSVLDERRGGQQEIRNGGLCSAGSQLLEALST